MNYVGAITAAVEVANVAGKGVKYLVEHADDIKNNIDSLASMLRSAKKLYNTAEDVVDPLVKAMAVETDEAIIAVEGVGSTEDDVSQSVPQKPGKAAGILKGAAEKVAVFADERKSDVNRWKLERELRKTVHDAKRTVLDGANIKMPLAKLVEQLNSEDDAVRLANLGVLDSSGCFAIATYGKFDRGETLRIIVASSLARPNVLATALRRQSCLRVMPMFTPISSTSKMYGCMCSRAFPKSWMRSMRR